MFALQVTNFSVMLDGRASWSTSSSSSSSSSWSSSSSVCPQFLRHRKLDIQTLRYWELGQSKFCVKRKRSRRRRRRERKRILNQKEIEKYQKTKSEIAHSSRFDLLFFFRNDAKMLWWLTYLCTWLIKPNDNPLDKIGVLVEFFSLLCFSLDQSVFAQPWILIFCVSDTINTRPLSQKMAESFFPKIMTRSKSHYDAPAIAPTPWLLVLTKDINILDFWVSACFESVFVFEKM